MVTLLKHLQQIHIFSHILLESKDDLFCGLCVEFETQCTILAITYHTIPIY